MIVMFQAISNLQGCQLLHGKDFISLFTAYSLLRISRHGQGSR